MRAPIRLYGHACDEERARTGSPGLHGDEARRLAGPVSHVVRLCSEYGPEIDVMVDAVGGPWQTPADAITLGRHLERYGPAILRGSGVGREHRRSDARRDDRVAGDRERPRPRSRPPRTRRRPGRGGDRAAHSARQRHLRRRGPGLRPPVRRRPPAPRRLAGRLSTIRCGVRWSQLHDRTTACLRTVMGERISGSAQRVPNPYDAVPLTEM